MGVKIKKEKNTKKCVIRGKIKFEDYKNCLEATHIRKALDLVNWERLFDRKDINAQVTVLKGAPKL